MLPVLKPFQNTTKRAANSAGNRLTEFDGIDLSYDGAGNLSEKKLPDGTHLHFGYDALNRMVSLERHNPDGSTLRARYAYDVFNRRIRKSVSQGRNTTPRVTHYGWDGERMCAEVMDALTRTTIYEPGSHVPLLRIDQRSRGLSLAFEHFDVIQDLTMLPVLKPFQNTTKRAANS